MSVGGERPPAARVRVLGRVARSLRPPGGLVLSSAGRRAEVDRLAVVRPLGRGSLGIHGHPADRIDLGHVRPAGLPSHGSSRRHRQGRPPAPGANLSSPGGRGARGRPRRAPGRRRSKSRRSVEPSGGRAPVSGFLIAEPAAGVRVPRGERRHLAGRPRARHLDRSARRISRALVRGSGPSAVAHAGASLGGTAHRFARALGN
jgi:hypothetical protein